MKNSLKKLVTLSSGKTIKVKLSISICSAKDSGDCYTVVVNSPNPSKNAMLRIVRRTKESIPEEKINELVENYIMHCITTPKDK